MDSHRLHRRRNNLRSRDVLLLIVSLPAILFSVAVAGEEKVKLEVYYEALCPYSADFIINDLHKIFENGLISIVDLKLSPYGNARISSDGTIVCQHGERECFLNTIQPCAIHVWPAVSKHFPFIYCVEQLNNEEKCNDEWESCFEILNLDPKPVYDCYRSGLGHKLEVGHAKATKALNPPHVYVPWVVINGQPIYEDLTDLTSYICKAYKGSNVPRACIGISTAKNNIKPSNRVCYKEDNDVESKLTLSEIISSGVANWI